MHTSCFYDIGAIVRRSDVSKCGFPNIRKECVSFNGVGVHNRHTPCSVVKGEDHGYCVVNICIHDIGIISLYAAGEDIAICNMHDT